MKTILFVLLLPLAALAQNGIALFDSVAVDSPKSVTIKDVVIVSSTRAGENAPMAVQLVTKAELEKNNLGQDIPFLLDETPSTVVTSNAGAGVGYTTLRIRGSDNTRVNVTLNGVPVNDAAEQGVYWVDIPDVVSSLQNIEIQRGVGTSTNGPGAFGGTLNMQTQSPAQKAYGEANVSGGSFQTMKLNAKFGTGLIKDRYFLEGSASYITSNGYVDRAFSRLGSWFFQTGYIYKNTLIKALYFGGREKTYQAWDGVPQDTLPVHRTYNDLGTDGGPHYPPYANQTDNYGQDYLQLLFAQQFPQHLSLHVGLFTTLGRGYYEEYKVAQNFQTYFPNYDSGITTDLVRQKWLKNVFYGGTFSLDYNYKNIDAVFGGLVSQFVGSDFGKVIEAFGVPNYGFANQDYYYSPSVKNDFNVYAKATYTVADKVNLYGDLQYRYASYNTSGLDDELDSIKIKQTWNFVNPKAGVLYKINQRHQVYISFAIGNREPDRDDLLASPTNPPHAELLRDLEAGYKGNYHLSPSVDAAFNANYYLMDYKDQLVLTGQLNDVGDYIQTNVPNSYRTGLEVYGGFAFYHYSGTVERLTKRKIFSIGYALTYSINKITNFNEYLYTYDLNYNVVDSLTQLINHKNTNIAYSPDFVGSLDLTVYPVKGLSISLMNKYVSQQFLDNTSNEGRVIPAFYYSNINISYTIGLDKPGKEITFKILLNNIFNHLYVSDGATYPGRYEYLDNNNQVQIGPVSSNNYYFPQAGFNVLAGMSVRF